MDHILRTRSEFAKQAESFNDPQHTLGDHQLMEWIVQTVQPSALEDVLDVAAGTVVLGCALAKHAKKVTAIDASQALLEVGCRAATEAQLTNIEFLIGDVEKLPFHGGEFDLVVSRLAIHHFFNPAAAIS